MGKDPSEIRREIEETRARLGDTVEALSYKADVPARMKDAVNERVDTVRGTLGDVVDSVKGTVTSVAGTASDVLGSVAGTATDALGSARGRLGSALGGASRTMSQSLGATTDKMGDATSTVSSSMSNLTSSVTGAVGNVTQKLPNPNDLTSAAQRGVGIATENPLGLAIGALAVGFLAGLAAPVTDIEREKVGPIRDELLERAKNVGTDALQHGKQVLQETAQAAIGAAQQAAQQHGQQVLSEAKGDSVHGQDQNGGDGAKEQGQNGGQGASLAGMPADSQQGGGLRSETLKRGTGAQTSEDTGSTSSRYSGLTNNDASS